MLDIREHAIFADYFVICDGTSDRMLKALQDAARNDIHEKFELRPRLEGEPRDGWVLVDYGDVVVHLFSPEKRDYYRLEELWSQGKVLLHLQ